MGGWFTARPVASYRARWLGDNLADVEADVLLPSRLTFTVLGSGDLRVTDPVLSHTHDVAVGGWFNEFQAWPPGQLELTDQELPGPGPWEFWVTGGELPAS